MSTPTNSEADSELADLKQKIEAVIYAAEEPVTLAQLATLFREELKPSELSDGNLGEENPADTEPGDGELSESSSSEEALAAERKRASALDRQLRERMRVLVDELIAEYAAGRGMEIREVAGGFRMATKPEYHDAVRQFVKSLKPALKLSLPALETLAVIAYKQPVTAPEIGEIRGVDSAGVLGSLMARKLITTAGRKQVVGRPILYKTTREFLLRFGLKDVSELPSIQEFEKMASEVADMEDTEEMGETYPLALTSDVSPDGDGSTDLEASENANGGGESSDVTGADKIGETSELQSIEIEVEEVEEHQDKQDRQNEHEQEHTTNKVAE